LRREKFFRGRQLAGEAADSWAFMLDGPDLDDLNMPRWLDFLGRALGFTTAEMRWRVGNLRRRIRHALHAEQLTVPGAHATGEPIMLGQRVVAIRRRRAPILPSLGAAFSPLVALVLAEAYSRSAPEYVKNFALYLAGSGLLTLLLGLLAVAVSKWGPVQAMVTVNDREFVLGLAEGARRIGRDQIVSGAFMPAEGRLDLTLDNGDVLELRAHGAQDAEAVAALLGVGAEQRRALFEERRPIAQLVMGCAGALTFVPWLAFATWFNITERISPAALAFIVVVSALTSLAFRRAMSRPSIRVGVDGVTLRKRAKERRWGLAAIAYVEADRDALVITERSGAEERVRVGPSAARAARDRIRDLMAIDSALDSDRVGLVHEIRSARENLRARLWRLLASRGTHRAAGWSADDLVAMIAAKGVSRHERVGAAWALGLAGSDADKHRARVASARIGDPEVRFAVERALEDWIAEYELEELAAEDEAQAATVRR
jgi:hypothetical protein